MEEKELVKKAKQGDRQAFASLYEMIYKDLYRFAVYTMKNEHDAEDAVSQAIVAAFQGISMLKDEESFKNWMFTIVSNECKKIWRVQKKNMEKAERVMPEEAMLSGEPVMEEGILKNPEFLDVRTAFFELTPKERMVLSMTLFGGYKSDEVGKHLSLSAGSIRSLKNRAIVKLRQRLGMERRFS